MKKVTRLKDLAEGLGAVSYTHLDVYKRQRQVYPVNAKYCQKLLGNFTSIHTRTKDASLLNVTAISETEQLMRLTDYIRRSILGEEQR